MGVGLTVLLVTGQGVAATPTPTVRGTAEVGQTLEASVDGRPPSRWSWARCPADADEGVPSPDVFQRECSSIEGATSALYAVRDADTGHRLRAVATYGDDIEPSRATAVVRRPPVSNASPPALTSTGVPAIGATVTWTVGRWTNVTTLDVIVQRCRPDGGACQDVDTSSQAYSEGQTASYGVRAADAGHVLVLAVQAQGDEATRVRAAATPVVPTPAPPSVSPSAPAAPSPAPTPPPPPPTPPAPPAPPTSPGVVADLRARLDVNVVRLTWRAPQGRSVVVVRRIGRRPVGADDGRIVYVGRARAARDTPRSTRRVWYGVFLVRGVTASAGVPSRPAYASLPHVVPRLLAPLQGARQGRSVRFAWRPVRTAQYYNVQIWNRRVTRRIVTRWPVGRTLTLRLAPGSYRWYVYPGYGPRAAVRYGKLIGQGSFTVR